MATDITINPAAGMPPVETQSTGTNASTSTSGIVQSPAAALAEKQAQGELENVANTEAEVAPALEKSLAAKSTAQNLIAANAETGINEVNDLVKARQPILDQAQREADQAEQAFANHKFHDYFSDKTTGDKIVARLAIGLNAFGNGILGVQGNEVADRLQHAIDLDFKKQEKELYSKEKMAEWKRQGVKDLYGRLNDEIATLKMKQALAHEAVAAKAEAMMTQAGIPLEVAKQNVISAQRRADAFKYRAENKQRLEQKVDRQVGQTTSNQLTTAKQSGQGVEADKNAANFEVLKNHGQRIAEQMPKLSKDDIQALNRVMNSEDFLDGKPLFTTAGSIVGLDPETNISDTAKAYLMDVRAAAEGLGRVQSGAAIGSVENKRFVRSFMPQISDSPKALQQRADNIIADINTRGKFLDRPARNQMQGATSAPLPKDPEKIKRAKAVLANPKSREVSKAGAKAYLEMVNAN